MTTARVPEFNRGDRLRKARETAGLKSDQMAERMGVSRYTVRNWEKNRAITKASIRMWAELTGAPADWIETGRDLPSEHSGGSRRRPHPLAPPCRYEIHRRTADGEVTVT